MRNMKKFLALVLAMLMITSMAVVTTSAADEADYTEAAQTLVGLKVMLGDENGDLMLEQGVKRYQASLFFVRALTAKVDTATWNADQNSTNFADVQMYGTAIDYAAGLGVVKGRGEGVFGYDDPIIYQDMVTMAVRALGYETADMQYPYGHMLAAQKLGLLENIEIFNNKKELTRGETAQLIANMLETKVAVTDPLSGKVIYPDEEDASLVAMLNPTAAAQLKADRKTLIEKAGFASGKLNAVVTAPFAAADENDEDSFDSVKVTYTYVDGTRVVSAPEMVVKAADLGITAETAPSTYLGLPVTLLVDCAAKDFAGKYADEEATIVLADPVDLTTVLNLGDEGNIKFVAGADEASSYVALNGVKFYGDEFEGELYLWNDTNGWTKQDQSAWAALADSYAWTSKDGYTATTGNTYGQVQYYVETVEDDKDIVHAFYTDVLFGQYATRDLTYAVTSEVTTFTLVGDIKADVVDGEATLTTLKFVGSTTEFNNSKASVRKNVGELASTVTVTGEAVQSGDFMFYTYNKADNVLNVVKNCGTFETGRMTATSATAGKETVKINGTTYGFGFAGLFTAEGQTAYNNTAVKDLISALKAGQDNVEFLAVDGNIIYLAAATGNDDASEYNFAIITTDAQTIADLLGITKKQYEESLIGDYTDFAGVYVKDGYVVVAMLDVTTGEWALANIAKVATTYTDDTNTTEVDYDFGGYVDVATTAGYYEITTGISNEREYKNATALLKTGLVMVVDATDDVYTIADIATAEEGVALVESVANTNGLVFSASGVSNAITASATVDAARVTTNENTVLVVVNTTSKTVGVRVGVQTAETKVDGTVNFYAAGADLIVMTSASFDVVAWGNMDVAKENENYFIKTGDTNYEYETTENEDEYVLTVTGLYDLKNLKAADDLVITGTKAEVEALIVVVDGADVADVLFLDENGGLTDNGAAPAAVQNAMKLLVSTKAVAYALAEIKAFDDENTIAVDFADTSIVDVDTLTAVSAIDVKVATVDLTGYDWATMDLDTMYVTDALVDADKYDGVTVDTFVEGSDTEYYAYSIDLGAEVVELVAPEADVLDNFAIDMAGKTISVTDEEGDEFLFTVDFATVAVYDAETDTVSAYVVKLVTAK